MGLAEVAAGGSLVVLVVLAVIRVLTFDRDESSVIQAWKARAEAETARADRFDAENRKLRREVRRLNRIIDETNLKELGRQNMRQAIDEQRDDDRRRGTTGLD